MRAILQQYCNIFATNKNAKISSFFAYRSAPNAPKQLSAYRAPLIFIFLKPSSPVPFVNWMKFTKSPKNCHQKK